MKFYPWVGSAGALALAACAAAPVAPPAKDLPQPAVAAAPICPEGQEPMRLAQLFFGRNVGAEQTVSEAEFQTFVDEELTPRFPEGLTVIDGGGQWRGSENQLIREAAKVVLIVMPSQSDRAKINEARDAYKQRFGQESVLLVTQKTCVSF